MPLRDSYELPSERVEAELRRRLAEEWHSGERLPPLSRLAAEFDVSQGTVARVLRKLHEIIDRIDAAVREIRKEQDKQE